MIEKMECGIMHCDGCGETYTNGLGKWWFLDAERQAVKYGGWIKKDGRHYCRECAKEKGLIERE